jgi:hypothetical protein
MIGFALFFLVGGLLFFAMAVVLVLINIIIISSWKIYQKAGFEGWECLIPIYNYLVFFKIIGKPWYWLLLLIVPIFNIVVYVWGLNLLSKRFGKDLGFTLGLLFLPYFFFPILAFGNAKYRPEEQS